MTERTDLDGLIGAYGVADDTTAILRGLASPDLDVSQEALDGFFSSVWHQGTVYPVTVAVVPRLVDLLCRPVAEGGATHHRGVLCFALGGIADPHLSDGCSLHAVRQAVCRHAPAVVALLTDDDPEVREAASYVMALSEADSALDALTIRWDIEDDATVRAGLLLGIAALDPAAGVGLATKAFTEPFPVTLTAARTLLGAGRTIPPNAYTALREAVTKEHDWHGTWAESVGSHDSVADLLDQGTFGDLVGALGAGSAKDRVVAAERLESRSRANRRAARESVAQVRRLLRDGNPAVVMAAVDAADAAGVAATGVADDLVRIATDDTSDFRGPANRSLAVLLRLRDGRVGALLAAAWDRGESPQAVRLLDEYAPRFDPELFAATRRRLAALLSAWRADGSPEDAWSGVDDWARGPGPLVTLVGAWGSDASDALDDLVGALRVAPYAVPAALASLGPAAVEAVPALLELTEGDGATAVRAAHAVFQLTSDPGPLVAAGAALLGNRQCPEWEIGLVADAGPAALPLLPAVLPFLTGAEPVGVPGQVAAARLVWRATGSLDPAVPALDAALRADFGSAQAASLVVDLPSDLLAPLGPALKVALAKGSVATPGAALALWRTGTPSSELVPLLLTGLVEQRFGAWQPSPVAVIGMMEDPSAAPTLRALAEQDARTVTRGLISPSTGADASWDDDALCADMLRTANELGRVAKAAGEPVEGGGEALTGVVATGGLV